jgi:hypothetical protein
MSETDDIWYAIANTEVLLSPQRRLETFGNTIITYHLITEKMDAINEVRIREGRVHAERPQILSPSYFERLMIDGFGNDGQQYVDWLKQHVQDLTFLKYGFRFRKEEMSETILHENVKDVGVRIKERVAERGDPLTAVIKGVDDAWEVCLLKFVTDTIRQSVPEHVMNLKKRKLLEEIEGVPRAVREEIEMDFETAGKDAAKMKALGSKLRHYGLFENYEDRFYELVRRVSG